MSPTERDQRNNRRATEVIMPLTFKRGIYETSYGNTAYVSGPKAKTAWDLDMQERIPIEEVTTKYLRQPTPDDPPRRY